MSRIEKARTENVRVDALTQKFLEPIKSPIESRAGLEELRQAWLRRDSVPFVLAGREEAVDHSWSGLDVRTLLRSDDSSGRASAHDVIIPGGQSFPRHSLETADVYLVIVRGELDIRVGATSRQAREGSFAFVPACTTLEIRNDSNSPAQLYMIYSPGGVDRAFAEAHDHWIATRDPATSAYNDILSRFGFDFGRDQAANDALTNAPTTRLEAKVESFEQFTELRSNWFDKKPIPRLIEDLSGCWSLCIPDGPTAVNSHVIFSGDVTGGRAVLFKGELDPGYSAPPHFQPSEEEMFYLLAGELTLTCGNHTQRIGPGAFGFAPRGATHGFRNSGREIATVVTLNAPAGHERGFEMIEHFMANPRDGLETELSNHGWLMHSMDDMGPQGTHR